MKNDVILNNISIIERCLKRINEEYDHHPKHLVNETKQDSIVLNLQRATEACITIAMHIIAERQLGLPQKSQDAFSILKAEGIISPFLSEKMQAIIEFRNHLIHNYYEVNSATLQKIIENHLDDYTNLTKSILLY